MWGCTYRYFLDWANTYVPWNIGENAIPILVCYHNPCTCIKPSDVLSYNPKFQGGIPRYPSLYEPLNSARQSPHSDNSSVAYKPSRVPQTNRHFPCLQWVAINRLYTSNSNFNDTPETLRTFEKPTLYSFLSVDYITHFYSHETAIPSSHYTISPWRFCTKKVTKSTHFTLYVSYPRCRVYTIYAWWRVPCMYITL